VPCAKQKRLEAKLHAENVSEMSVFHALCGHLNIFMVKLPSACDVVAHHSDSSWRHERACPFQKLSLYILSFRLKMNTSVCETAQFE
jgi:hypothetical protein